MTRKLQSSNEVALNSSYTVGNIPRKTQQSEFGSISNYRNLPCCQETMDLRELTSLAKQVQLAYTHTRDANSKVQLHVTSLHLGPFAVWSPHNYQC